MPTTGNATRCYQKPRRWRCACAVKPVSPPSWPRSPLPRLNAAHTVLVLAPAERQAKELARKVVAFIPKTALVVERSTLTELELTNGGRLICVPASGATIRGYTIELLLIDEAAFCDEEAITAVLPMVTDNGRTVFSSTTGLRSGYFANIFLQSGNIDEVHKIIVRGSQIPRLARKVARLRAVLPPHRFRAEVEVEFIAEGRVISTWPR